jgi:cyclopropane fatty-acyl-phospholipid synthase-like methyltransferase
MERKQGSKLSPSESSNHILVYEGHLGGCCLVGDGATYYPRMWDHMIAKYNLKTMVDIGCGGGFALDYFRDLGVEVRGVEGATEAIEKNLVPRELLVRHDYEKDGPYIPEREFDLAWTCEFVEHVEAKCMNNFLETFKKSKIVAMTYAVPGQGGHHHVNEQHEPYWINAIESAGFVYDPADTAELREVAKLDMSKYSPCYTSHFIERGLIFKRTQ